MKPIKFKIKVGELVFEGACDGSLVEESWTGPTTKKLRQDDPDIVQRLKLTITLGNDVRGKVTRPPDTRAGETKKTTRAFGSKKRKMAMSRLDEIERLIAKPADDGEWIAMLAEHGCHLREEYDRLIEQAPAHLRWLTAVTRELVDVLEGSPIPVDSDDCWEAWLIRRRAVLDRLERGV